MLMLIIIRVAGGDFAAPVEGDAELAELFDRRIPLSSALAEERLAGLERVWYVRSDLATSGSIQRDAALLRAAGFTRESTWSGPHTSVEQWARSGG